MLWIFLAINFVIVIAFWIAITVVTWDMHTIATIGESFWKLYYVQSKVQYCDIALTSGVLIYATIKALLTLSNNFNTERLKNEMCRLKLMLLLVPSINMSWVLFQIWVEV